MRIWIKVSFALLLAASLSISSLTFKRYQQSVSNSSIDLASSCPLRDDNVLPEPKKGRIVAIPDVALGDLPSVGSRAAPVTVTVFSDFECPYCAKFATMMRKEVLPKTGHNVRLVFRQLPLMMHPWARGAAEASICVYAQDRDYFWAFHDMVFSHQSELTADNLRAKVIEYAGAITGINREKFEACLISGQSKPTLERELEFAKKSGIHATPSVFINGVKARTSDSAEMIALIGRLAINPNAPIPSPREPDDRTPVRKRKQPEIADISSGNFPAFGPVSAEITLTVFSDFECPYCARFAKMMREDVLPSAAGNIRVLFRQLPLEMHPWARMAAEASECAYQQRNEYFWNFHDFFFDHQRDLTVQNFRQQVIDHAGRIQGFRIEQFEGCLVHNGATATIDQEVRYASSHGIEGTPTVFINNRQFTVISSEQLQTIIWELRSIPLAFGRTSIGFQD